MAGRSDITSSVLPRMQGQGESAAQHVFPLESRGAETAFQEIRFSATLKRMIYWETSTECKLLSPLPCCKWSIKQSFTCSSSGKFYENVLQLGLCLCAAPCRSDPRPSFPKEIKGERERNMPQSSAKFGRKKAGSRMLGNVH